MRAVWKFFLRPNITALAMPKNSVALHVHAQGSDIYLWALVDPDMPKVERKFLTIGTGDEFEARPTSYIGTSHIGGLVFHTFELLEVA